MTKNIRKALGVVLMAGLVWTACDQGAVAPEAAPEGPGVVAFAADGVVELEEFEVCKYGTSANFDWTLGGAAQSMFSLNDGECVVLDTAGGAGNTISVTERVGDFADRQLDNIVVEVLDATGTSNPPASSATGHTDFYGGAGVVNGPRGVIVSFYNSFIPQEGGEGCTPGFWGNRAGTYSQGKGNQSKPSEWTTYHPTDSYDATFGVVSSFGGGYTLIEAVLDKGGAENQLASHATAALLNAAHAGVSFDMTEGEVIALVQAAYASGDLEGAKNTLAELNEQGCPL